jgi:hypothetical protein
VDPLPPLRPTVEARVSLHRTAVAISARQQSTNGRYQLEVSPGGFGTGWFDEDGQRVRLRVSGTDLMREHPGGVERSPLGLEAAAVEVLVAWWQLGQRVLEAVVAEPGESLAPIVLYPEHFDVATTLTTVGGGLNLGFSPGDEFSAEPYVYAGPFEPIETKFWNAPFGAWRRYTEIAVRDPADTAAAFFAAARQAYADAMAPGSRP